MEHIVFAANKVLEENVTALVTALMCPQRRIVSAMTETFGTPHLSVDLEPCPSLTSEKFTINLTLENTNVATVLVDIVEATERKNVHLKFGNRVGK